MAFELKRPSMTNGLRRLFSFLGLALSIACLVYIGRALVSAAGEGALQSLAYAGYTALAIASTIYCGLLLLLPLAWSVSLRVLGTATAYRRDFGFYGFTQAWKYLPSNLMQFPARQVYALREGWPQRNIAISTVVEIAGQAGAAVAIILASLPLASSELAGILGSSGYSSLAGVSVPALPWVIPTIVIAVAVAAIAALYLRSVPILRASGTALFRTLPVYALFLFGIYGNFVVVAATLGVSAHLFWVGTAAVAAWLGGFLTPGSPAGLGVREVIFIALTGGFLGDDIALSCVLLVRLASLIGDGLFLVVAAFAVRRLSA
jgi:hypothetical protein